MASLADDVVKTIRSMLATSVKGKHVDIALSANESHVAFGCFRYKLYCVSCSKCQKNQGWRGTATYNSSSMTLRIIGLGYDAHGQFDRVYGAREKALNSQHQGAIRSWLQKNHYKIAALMVELTKLFKESCPEESAVRYYVRNLFARRKEFKQKNNRHFQWTRQDFLALLRRLPTLESSAADCNDLVVLQAFVEKDFFISFVHPRLFRCLGRHREDFLFPRQTWWRAFHTGNLLHSC